MSQRPRYTWGDPGPAGGAGCAAPGQGLRSHPLRGRRAWVVCGLRVRIRAPRQLSFGVREHALDPPGPEGAIAGARIQPELFLADFERGDAKKVAAFTEKLQLPGEGEGVRLLQQLLTR